MYSEKHLVSPEDVDFIIGSFKGSNIAAHFHVTGHALIVNVRYQRDTCVIDARPSTDIRQTWLIPTAIRQTKPAFYSANMYLRLNLIAAF